MKICFISLIISSLFSVSMFPMNYAEYIKSDYRQIKKESKKNACYKRMLRRVSLKSALRQKNKVKSFCNNKIRGRKITYYGESWIAYTFYIGSRRCKKGRYWFIPKEDCNKISF